MSQFDCNTPEGFRAAREALNLSDSALSMVIGIDRRTIRRWESVDNDLEPHPTAARMLEGMVEGFRPPEYAEKMSGWEFGGFINGLGLSYAEAAKILDVEEKTVELWTSDDRGPTPIAIRALRWYNEGWRPRS